MSETVPPQPAHRPVLLDEVLEWLAPRDGSIIVDGTVGAGGHAAELARRVGATGHVYGFDRDPAMLALAAETTRGLPVTLVHAPYSAIEVELAQRGQVSGLDGLLMDLGLSSDQLAWGERGFSFASDGPLDMRFDPATALTAEEIVNTYAADALADIFFYLGEERFSRRVARKLVEYRESRGPIETTAQLAGIVRRAIPGKRGKIDPATRVFQALRIAVNDELEHLDFTLERVASWLKPGGRVGVISFHSLEDRRVKQSFRGNELLRVLTKKPITASEEEIRRNPRAERETQGGRAMDRNEQAERDAAIEHVAQAQTSDSSRAEAESEHEEKARARIAPGWGTRVKIAVVISFIALVGAQVAGRFKGGEGKGKGSDKGANQPPSLAIGNGEGVRQTSAEQAAGDRAAVEQAALETAETDEPPTPAAAAPITNALVDLTSERPQPPPPAITATVVSPPVGSEGSKPEPPSPAPAPANDQPETDIAAPVGLEDAAPTPAPFAGLSPPVAANVDPVNALEDPTTPKSEGAPATNLVPTPGGQTGESALSQIPPQTPVTPQTLALDTPPATVPIVTPIRSTQPLPASRTDEGNLVSPKRKARPAADLVGGRIEPITHVVRRGENFWTIARHYYGSGRFYRALWKANEDRVPKIDELYIGTPILVPAPEELDRALIDPPGRGARMSADADRQTASREDRILRDDATVRASTTDDGLFDVADPVEKPRSEPEPKPSGTRTYVTKGTESLRKIAARELGDAKRDEELLKLNADVVDDPFYVPGGTVLRLPAK